MPIAVTVSLLLVQQLQVVPSPSQVGVAAQVIVRQLGEPLVGLVVEAEQPDGTAVPLGATDSRGGVAFVPSLPGDHVIAARIDGVRVLLPHRVVAPRSRWLMALGCVPIGLAALWALARKRRQRDPGLRA